MSQQAALVPGLGNNYFPAAAQSLETWPCWLRTYSCELSLATLESKTRDFSLTVLAMLCARSCLISGETAWW